MFSRFAKCLCFSALLLAIGVARAQAGEVPLADAVPHITVTGSAHADVRPDIAIIALGVFSERPTAAEAMSENARAAQAVVNEIKGQGVDARDIKTTQVSLSPVYDNITDPVSHTTSRKLRGYSASNMLDVRVRDIDQAGKLAGQWIGSGTNRVQGVRFEIAHPDAAYEKLRGEAVQDALRRAQAYLSVTSAKLGRIIEVADQDVPLAPTPRFHAMVGAPENAASTAIPIEPGTETLHCTVRVTWEIVQ